MTNIPFIDGFNETNPVSDIVTTFAPDWYREGPSVDLTEQDRLLIAVYTYENYDGNAFVLYERDGVLYEVNGGHCSCYGLEGQWQPEETTWAALLKRTFRGGGWGHHDPWNQIGGVILELAAKSGHVALSS